MCKEGSDNEVMTGRRRFEFAVPEYLCVHLLDSKMAGSGS
uniref:Uncharacterized protein n=1 Tax=Arundo donax TaxID=35708 RepID=A0A0A8ZEM0_ARUDO